MEISAPSFHPQQWRTATLVACGVAAFELVLLVIIAVAILSKPGSADAKRSSPARQAAAHAEPRRATLSRTETKVLVLNGNGIAGAAAAEASRLRARGYTVSATGNAAQNYGQSVVLYRPGHLPEARRLAADEGIPLVGPLDGLTLHELHGAHVAIVLGT